jgi:hypothetical protein
LEFKSASFKFTNKISKNKMKKTLLIALLLIPIIGISQTTKPIEGFLSIKFGSSKADVMAAMEAKGGALIKGSTDDNLFFSNISLGHRAAQAFEVKLFNDKAYFGAFIFQPENEASTLGFYDNLVNDISDVYGKGKATVSFKDPYKFGDGNETQAISLSEGHMFTDWHSDKNSIQVNVTTKLKVVLMYVDNTTDEQAKAAQKAKEKSDF